MQMNEWEILYHLHPCYNIEIDSLEIIGHRDFDFNHNWSHTSIPLHLQETTINFIEFNCSNNQNQHRPLSTLPQYHTLSPTQQKYFTLVISHFKSPPPNPSLKIIIKGTTGTRNSSLHILIKSMHPLEGQSLLHLPEKLCYVEYILIDEMRFITQKMLSRIDDRLREAFPLHRNTPFGNRSIILVEDLGQLPPVKEIPLYVGTSCGTALWRSFDTFVTLTTIFHQQGADPSQVAFRWILTNLRNGTPTLEYWNLLMSRIDSSTTH